MGTKVITRRVSKFRVSSFEEKQKQRFNAKGAEELRLAEEGLINSAVPQFRSSALQFTSRYANYMEAWELMKQ